MSEATFSKFITQNLRKNGFFVQRIEATTGSGIPDLVALGYSKTFWIELKWKTQNIRPEQYAWAVKADRLGSVLVNYLVGYEDKMELFNFIDGTLLKNSFKLRHPYTFPKKAAAMQTLIERLR